MEAVNENVATDLQPQTTGAMIDRMFDIREQEKALNDALKDLGAQKKELESVLLERLDADETTMSRGKLASVTITESIVPQVIDWDAFYQYIAEHDAPYMLERRPAVGPFREHYQANEAIPGVEPFNRRALSLRKV